MFVSTTIDEKLFIALFLPFDKRSLLFDFITNANALFYHSEDLVFQVKVNFFIDLLAYTPRKVK